MSALYIAEYLSGESRLKIEFYEIAIKEIAEQYIDHSQCATYNLSSKYVTDSPIKQEILQMEIGWKNQGNIEEYMSIHQHDPNANELWRYF